MTAEYHPDLVASLIAVSTCLLVPCSWFTFQTARNAADILSAPSFVRNKSTTRITSLSHHSHGSTQTSSTMQPTPMMLSKQRQGSAQWTMGYTVLSSCFFTLSIFINVVRRSVYYHRISDDRSDREKRISVSKKSDLISALSVLYFTLGFLGYGTLITACFQRLILTFQHSQYRLSQREKMLGNGTIAGIMLLMFSALAIARLTGDILISSLISFPALLAFPLMFGGITFRFMNTTSTLAQKMIAVRSRSHSRGTSLSSDIQEKSKEEELKEENNQDSVVQRTRELLDASLRLTLVTTMSLSSTIFTALFSAVAFVAGSKPMIRIVVFLIPMDSFVNVFSLLCSFHQARPYYDAVFRSLHLMLLDKLTERLTGDPQN